MVSQAFVISIIEGRKKAPVCRAVLYGLSLLFQGVSYLRNWLYDAGVIPSYKSVLPVVSVGNLVAGGTGKTPFVKQLMQELKAQPGAVAVLTRGYRSSNQKSAVKVENQSAAAVGDEAVILARGTNALVFSGKDRVASAKQAEKDGARLILLEDGMQHRRLQRDQEIVLLDGLDLWGKGFFLPRGYLRDSPKRLKRADWIVITHFDEVEDQERVFQEVKRWSSAPIIGVRANYRASTRLEGRKVAAFCGIAKPASFFSALEKRGAAVTRRLVSQDHEIPSLEELKAFAAQGKEAGADMLFCTEKDAVKLPLGASFALPLEILHMELEPIFNENFWKEMVQVLQNKLYLKRSL